MPTRSDRKRISKAVKADDRFPGAHVLDGNCERAFVGLYFVIKPSTLRNLTPRTQGPLPKYLNCSGPLPGLVMDLLIQPLSVIHRVWTPHHREPPTWPQHLRFVKFGEGAQMCNLSQGLRCSCSSYLVLQLQLRFPAGYVTYLRRT